MSKNEELINKKFTASDFELVQDDVKISDTKFESKPTTFFKDSIKRFSKNKSSIVGAFILGILIILAIFLPIFSPYDIDTIKKSEQFLAPKLFDVEDSDWWNGTKKYTHIIYDTDNEAPAGFYKPAVVSMTIDQEPTYIDQANSYGKGGYVMFVNENDGGNKTLSSYPTTFNNNGNYSVAIKLVDKNEVQSCELGEYRINFVYTVGDETQTIVLQDWSKNYTEVSFNLSDVLNNANVTSVKNASISFELKPGTNAYSYILIESVMFTANENVNNYDELVNNVSYSDATKMVLLKKDINGVEPVGYWRCTGRKGIHASKVYYCDFVFDTYANVYDAQEVTYAASDLNKLIAEGLCSYDHKVGPESFVKLDDKCPIDGIVDQQLNNITGKLLSVTAESYRYRKLGYDEMPKFLFGTDATGHDIVKKAFSGLRTSLILGVLTAIFCFVFGLCWGSISGYFGGNVDLIMERFCDILGGVPWVIVMTLCILHLGNNFGTFFIALCATGWMGTAARTRTQFYRFKGREYVLASRTLGSSDFRLIFKHILPNSLGTIITSSVFMITSVIYSEASLAYLNLGLQGVHSFGVMLADNQQYISTSPNLIVFPAVIMSLMMISFNLFGNGLRDAVNPSLKGSE